MAESSTVICNMALRHIGQANGIASLTERSEAASACNAFYDIARKATLRDLNWPFASLTEDLTLVEEDPTTEWAFSYRYPSQALKVIRIPSGVRNDTRQSRVAWKEVNDGAGGKLIYTDMEDAQAEYTFDEEVTSNFPEDFSLALSYRIAFYIAPSLARQQGPGIQKEMAAYYTDAIQSAAANIGNEEQPDELPDSEFVRGRTT